MKGKVIAITGGSSGIGEALAYSFGKRGAEILITGRSKEKLIATKNRLEKEKIRIDIFQADVSDKKSNENMYHFIEEKYNRLDLLINNAGVSMKALFEEVDLEVFRQVMETNFWGAVYATQFCLPLLKKSHGGIIGISSVAGLRGLPARTAYCASKFALHGFLEALRTEFAYQKMRVMIVSPGFIATNIRKESLNWKGETHGKTLRDESKMMDAQTCAEKIVRGFEKNKKHLILTRKGKLLYYLNKFWATKIDTLIYNSFAKEKDSLLKKEIT